MTTLPDAALAPLALNERIIADRMAWLMFAITEMSQHGYLLVRWSQRQWRVTVRWNGLEEQVTSPIISGDRIEALVPILDQALEWLRFHHVQPAPQGGIEE